MINSLAYMHAWLTTNRNRFFLDMESDARGHVESVVSVEARHRSYLLTTVPKTKTLTKSLDCVGNCSACSGVGELPTNIHGLRETWPKVEFSASAGTPPPSWIKAQMRCLQTVYK